MLAPLTCVRGSQLVERPAPVHGRVDRSACSGSALRRLSPLWPTGTSRLGRTRRRDLRLFGLYEILSRSKRREFPFDFFRFRVDYLKYLLAVSNHRLD